ncbi:[protein-PII] uridylyltransferase family protein [Yoonia sediminilitoris]|uniref:Glutamate-ammonia-ligase adenylyltransferase n=1 Tax=Yoonia sediminilitoris TaxID=1286148 RepID=A0A2T6KRL8_9RHOB|nr:glutamine-synthetase adenylyltransferase [Yoonia sediminilitoris]PUB19187.1 glutamate-ammonia-ligase adenylyltransferase [Yoonia sediminilitoris]RCW99355.1 glutamate-ammonia-ligase adenylyltransferase [Yoonia sediminilitoris]
MSIAARQTRCPDPYEPDRGADAVAHLPEIERSLQPLIAGTAGCSPYLAGLIAAEADWLPQAMDDPEAAIAEIMAKVPSLALSELPAGLRQGKRRIALLVALADLAGVWPLEQVTQVLTDFADASVQACLTELVAAEVARGKLPGGDDPALAGGMTALAMGKMGAGELNYSSDIDLICLFDETRFDPDDYHDVRSAFIRVTRKMTATLSDLAAGGYVFRTDLRLRPDASVTPVCLSMEAAERYYESVGRTWERAAYIKARACAGDIPAGARFLETLRPFVWRKHLDFAAIQDAHDMRLKIRDHKGLHGALVLEGHNMKLGRGGIREIEFFTQTRQLIAGGRDVSLRVRQTREGLSRLADANWVPHEVADTLYGDYRFHREVEHRLQMIGDAQTHTLPNDTDGFDRLAAFMGRDVAGLRSELTRRLEQVHGLTEGFFAPDAAPAPVTGDWGKDVTDRWPSYPALRTSRATEIFARLRPQIMASLQEAAKPDEALAQFDGFLAGLPAGVQLFSLFEANPQLTQLIVDIAATAPALSQYLSRNAAVLDAVIGGSFFDPWPDLPELVAALQAVLRAADDYEAKLIAARRWAKEWHFRIGVHHLRGLITADESGQQYAALADAVLTALWPEIVAEFAHKHGLPPGQGAVVLGMGSLGAARLNAASDLDLIVIYDADGVDASDGRRPLATRAYYARLTQALVTALSASMAEGRLYEVDMRLRPSGRQGPVATSFDSFCNYQRDEAWTWEHLALTRARPVAGNLEIGARIESFRVALLAEKGKATKVLSDVADMRDRIAGAKAPAGAWDAKIGAGRLQDTELFAQTAALCTGSSAREAPAQLAAGVAAGWLGDQQARAVGDASQLMWNIQAATRLLTDGAIDPDTLGEGGRRFLLRETGFDTMSDLLDAMESAAAAADAVISAKLKEP